MLTRRIFLNGFSGLLISGGFVTFSSLTAAKSDRVLAKVLEVEHRLGARLGMMALDVGTDKRWSYNADQRFPLCSTFKAVASAAFLKKVDDKSDSLSRRVVINESQLVSYSPMTETRVDGEGMTMSEICEAALTLSDNTAGNIILSAIGGPRGLTDFARSIGDQVFRLDRWETELNEAALGDPRDTTSPAAMTETLNRLLFGSVLSTSSRQQLQTWMASNKTGDAKLRAGLPTGWTIGDKTGGGNNGSMADVAFALAPERKPLVISVYLTETEASFDERNKGIADIARVLAETIV